MGDPAGIGPEVIAKAWDARRAAGLDPFFVVGDARAIERVWYGPVERIGDPSADAAACSIMALPVMVIEDAGDIVPGAPDPEGARCALHSLEMAAGLVRSGAAGALVTGPGIEAAPLRHRLHAPGPDRIRRRTMRDIAARMR